MNFSIELADEKTTDIVNRELTKSLRKALPQGNNQQFALAAKSAQSKLIGGLTASTSYGWLLIKTLWVDEEHRGNDIGKNLMNAAEEKGREAGCHSVWLDTSNPISKKFYDNLGYKVFGKLANENGQLPKSHCRWFMKKTL